jgi:hypothetical protein
MKAKRSIVVSIFHIRSAAEAAVEELCRRGFREDQVGILTRDDKAVQHVKIDEMGSKIGEGVIGGAIAGAGIGTLAGLAVVVGLMPPIGPALAGGILASILGSAGLGATAGGVVGSLIGLGVPEDEARYVEQEFQAGRTIVTVKAAGRYTEAWDCLHRHGAYDMKTPRQRVVAFPSAK